MSRTASSSRRRRTPRPPDAFVRVLRESVRRVADLRVALSAVLIAAAATSGAALWAFAELAEEVREGATQQFDDMVLAWLAQPHAAWLDPVMLEITALGNATVVLVTTGIAVLFLWLTRHRYSAYLLVASSVGGVLAMLLLKQYFDRPRPDALGWDTEVVTSSFPSGHATAAAVVYFTVGYLAARLQRRRWARWLTLATATLIVLLIAFSRVALGVHYPSDVAAGMAVGLGWAAFCMAMLEAIQRYIHRHAPAERAREAPTPEAEIEQAEDDAAERWRARGEHTGPGGRVGRDPRATHETRDETRDEARDAPTGTDR